MHHRKVLFNAYKPILSGFNISNIKDSDSYKILKTNNKEEIPVFVHSHHIHQHEKNEKFGIKSPIFIDHLVCF